MNRHGCLCVFVVILLTGGCRGEPKYIPTITLTKTGPTIDAVAEFHDLYPTYALLSGKEPFGVEAASVERVEPTEFTSQIENEFVTKLDAAGLFLRVTRFDPNPDIVLSGRITALHEHYRPQSWATLKDVVPYGGKLAQLLRLKTHISTGEVHLTLFVLKATGEVVGTYTGKSSFKEFFTPEKAQGPRPGLLLNRALSEAVHQIQDEIARDAEFRKLSSS